jgi:hypothetical protein
MRIFALIIRRNPPDDDAILRGNLPVDNSEIQNIHPENRRGSMSELTANVKDARSCIPCDSTSAEAFPIGQGPPDAAQIP